MPDHILALDEPELSPANERRGAERRALSFAAARAVAVQDELHGVHLELDTSAETAATDHDAAILPRSSDLERDQRRGIGLLDARLADHGPVLKALRTLPDECGEADLESSTRIEEYVSLALRSESDGPCGL